jgi:hypothetical protein
MPLRPAVEQLLERCASAKADGADFPTIWNTILKGNRLVVRHPVQALENGNPVLRVRLLNNQHLVYGPDGFSIVQPVGPLRSAQRVSVRPADDALIGDEPHSQDGFPILECLNRMAVGEAAGLEDRGPDGGEAHALRARKCTLAHQAVARGIGRAGPTTR